MTKNTSEQIAELRELEAKATPGQWILDNYYGSADGGCWQCSWHITQGRAVHQTQNAQDILQRDVVLAAGSNGPLSK